MRIKSPIITPKPLLLLFGAAFLILEIFSFATYQKHLPKLLKDLIQYDYNQKNWAFIPQPLHNVPVYDTLKIDLSEIEFQAWAAEWNQEYKNKYRETGKPWIGKKEKHKARIKLINANKSKWHKAEIAMMGMLPDHHGNFERMSIKVNLKGDQRLFKLKSFSLVLPETRMYFIDEIANRTFKNVYQGIQIKQKPVWVQFRKNRPVLMLVENKFDKYLIEANERRESIIFEKGFLGDLRDIPGIEEQHINIACNASLSDTNRQAQLESLAKATFNDPNFKRFDLIDSKKILGVWAIGMICQSWHHWVDINLHWYYNPVNHKFEPTIREVNLDPNWKLTGNLKSFENRKKEYQRILQKFQNEIVPGRKHFWIAYAKWAEKRDSLFWKKLDNEVGIAARNLLKILPEYQSPHLPLYPEEILKYQNYQKQLKQHAEELSQIPIHIAIQKRQRAVQHILPSTYTITQKVTIKPNEDIRVNPGTHIRMTGENALWIIRGGMQMAGTKDHPIIIEADSSCRASMYIESSDSVILKYVYFKGLSNLQFGYWKTPSSITVYNTSNVHFENCSFTENRSGDDYLNVFQCKNFCLSKCIFADVKSDALDSDFSSGTVTDTEFLRIGNDGIDGSGSQIKIANCIFTFIKDKAVSSGEKSAFTLTNSLIQNSEIGLVSKDQSSLKVQKTAIENVRLPVAIFQKKPEYGSATIHIDKDLNAFIYLIEEGSRITHTGRKIQMSENVKDLLYGNEYGSATQK